MRSVRVMMRAKPGRQRELADVLCHEASEVPALFAGCLRYGAFVDPEDDHQVLLYEEWSDEASFVAFSSSEYFERSGGWVFPLLDGAPEVAYYDSELVGP